MNRIKKGDEVVVISGRDKGKRGAVLRRVDAEHVVVEGVNRVKKHTKVGQSARGAKTGGIVTQEAAIHISNVKLVEAVTEEKPKKKAAAKKKAA